MLTLGYAYPNLVMAENYKETGQDQHIERTGSLGLLVNHALGRSGIYGLKRYERVELTTLLADLEPGSHLLISAVCGETAGSRQQSCLFSGRSFA
ncbi:hypothetical protein RB298_19765 [Priestia sp. BR_2]